MRHFLFPHESGHPLVHVVLVYIDSLDAYPYPELYMAIDRLLGLVF
jgi:hypothetical protein